MASEGIPFARAGNVNNGFRFGDQDLLGEEAIRTAGDKVSEPWDVVFTSKGTVGRFAVVYPTTRRFVYSPQLCFWRSLDHERLNPIFLLCWMRSSAFLDQVAAVSGQTDMALYVNLRDQRRMRMTLPSPAAQRELDHSLRPVVNRVELNERQVTTLAEARDTLLPKLLSGSLRIPEVERFLSSEVR
jgi:type I restriction enzyme, S subunit